MTWSVAQSWNPELVRNTLIQLAAVLYADDRPKPKAGTKPRGVGHGT